MNLRHRAMQPVDIPECVDIVAKHPVLGARYGPDIEHLPEAWRRLILRRVQLRSGSRGGRFERPHLLVRRHGNCD
jgi:hypothetical protein